MKKAMRIFGIASVIFSLVACKNDEVKVNAVTATLIDPLNAELLPLTEDPILWTDSQLSFMDEYSDNSIVGLGEATHGTSEFFKAKHRIFRYLVEKHGFRIFAIEADLGESYLINQAVMKSDKSSIVTLMKGKMKFWTWKTNEVRDMLLWMCDYNEGKEDSEKVQYWGFDCQYNTYNPGIVAEMLKNTDVPFMDWAQSVLDKTQVTTDKQFAGVSDSDFRKFLDDISSLTDSLTNYHDQIVAKTSEEDYQVMIQFLNVMRQSGTQVYDSVVKQITNHRDDYMAQNVGWLNTHFKKKMVLWAHNLHISNSSSGGSMGYYINGTYGADYAKIGFLFSKGSFRAITVDGDDYKALESQSLQSDPLGGSLNDAMYRAKTPVYTVDVSKLQGHQEWSAAFQNGLQFLVIGSVYDNKPADYYMPFKPEMFERLIYIDNTNSAVDVQ
jgi:erythromycin esterase